MAHYIILLACSRSTVKQNNRNHYLNRFLSISSQRRRGGLINEFSAARRALTNRLVQSHKGLRRCTWQLIVKLLDCHSAPLSSTHCCCGVFPIFPRYRGAGQSNPSRHRHLLVTAVEGSYVTERRQATHRPSSGRTTTPFEHTTETNKGTENGFALPILLSDKYRIKHLKFCIPRLNRLRRASCSMTHDVGMAFLPVCLFAVM